MDTVCLIYWHVIHGGHFSEGFSSRWTIYSSGTDALLTLRPKIICKRIWLESCPSKELCVTSLKTVIDVTGCCCVLIERQRIFFFSVLVSSERWRRVIKLSGNPLVSSSSGVRRCKQFEKLVHFSVPVLCAYTRNQFKSKLPIIYRILGKWIAIRVNLLKQNTRIFG